MTHSKVLGPDAPLINKKRTHENRTGRASGCASDQRSMTDNEAEKVSRTDCSPWRDRDTLRYYYLNREHSLLEVGELLGCAECTVLQWCKRNGIETRDPQEARDTGTPTELESEGWLRAEYLDKQRTCADIADELDVTDLTVSNWLRRHDIPTRPANRRRNRGTVVCECCGDEFEVKQGRVDTSKYCSRECYYEDMDMPTGSDHWDWKAGSYRNYQGHNWKTQRDRARERDGHTCQLCGVGEGEQNHDVHHLTPLREFDSAKEANKLDNLITLCRSCHMRAEKYAPLVPSGLEA